MNQVLNTEQVEYYKAKTIPDLTFSYTLIALGSDGFLWLNLF